MKIKNLINNIFILSLLIFFITSSNAGEIFVSLKKSKVNVRYGTGLGLPIVNKIINEHSGEFVIKKENGTKIEIWLPKI